MARACSSALADFVYLFRRILPALGTQCIGQYAKIFVLACKRFVTLRRPPKGVGSHLSRSISRRLGVGAVIIIDTATGIITGNAVVSFCGHDQMARRERNEQTRDQAFNVASSKPQRPLIPKPNIRLQRKIGRFGPIAPFRTAENRTVIRWPRRRGRATVCSGRLWLKLRHVR